MSSRLRVGINLCFVRGDALTGPRVYAEKLIEQLLDFDEYEWLIYCPGDVTVPASWTARGARIRRVPPSHLRPARIAFEQLILPVMTRRDRIALLFSPGFVSPLWGAPRLMATIHDMYYKVVPQVLPPWQRRYWQLFIPLTARRCDHLIAVSRCTANDLARFLPGTAGKIRVTHLAPALEGVDSADGGELPEEPVDGIGPGYVLFVANVVANKNPDVVAAAAARLRRDGRPREIVHVGEDHHGLLQAALDKFGCHASFRRIGRVSSGALRWLYRNALCTIQPSLYEGFGIPVLEAQAAGTPLICADAGPLPEIAGDGALYFSPRDDRRLAALINQLADSESLRASLIARGRENASRYTWRDTAAATMEAIRELLEEPARGNVM